MTRRGLEPSGSHESTLNIGHLNNNNHGFTNGSRRSSGRSSWKRQLLACSIIGSISLCLIQILISTTYLTPVENANYIRLMDLPAVLSGLQPTDANAKKDDVMNRMEYFINRTTPQPLLTLVHFDPKFLGGYRNQHMRFVSFVNFAVQNRIPQILLPSIRWVEAQGERKGRDVSFEYLFDVVHWNEHAEKAGLPRLVRYDASVLEGRRNDGINVAMGSNNQTRTTSIVACFNTSSNLYAGLDEKLLRNPNTNIRRVNIWDEIGKLDGYSHCRRSPPSSAGQEQQASEDVDGNAFTYLVAHGGSQGRSDGRLVSIVLDDGSELCQMIRTLSHQSLLTLTCSGTSTMRCNNREARQHKLSLWAIELLLSIPNTCLWKRPSIPFYVPVKQYGMQSNQPFNHLPLPRQSMFATRNCNQHPSSSHYIQE